jgi:4-amino-4-deoxy-L-arabinose transferase-like glycosyltransferase
MILNNDFPLYFHADEPKKLYFVMQGVQDFNHPILMLQLGRIATWLLGLSDPQTIMVVCRTISALLGVAMIVISFLLTRKILGSRFACAVVAMLAVSPIVVIHGHYYKEDMVFVATAMLAIYFYLNFIKNPTLYSSVVLGVGVGLVLAAQYKSIFLVGLFIIYPVLDRRLEIWRIYKLVLPAFFIAIVLAVAINYPALLDPGTFLSGFETETDHIRRGHKIKLFPVPQFFMFHLRNSLLPGITIPVALLGLGGLVAVISRWKKSPVELRFLVIYVLLFYLIHESTPMKPFPGYIRYMMPIVPAMLILAGHFIRISGNQISDRVQGAAGNLTVTFLVMVCILLPAYKSFNLLRNMNEQDTRARAFNWLKERQGDGEVYFGKYTLLKNTDSGRIYQLDDETIETLRAQGYRYAIASSFGYDLYFIGAELADQPGRISRYKDVFENVFSKYEYHEIRPNYQSFAFSNPTIRIIDLGVVGNN